MNPHQSIACFICYFKSHYSVVYLLIRTKRTITMDKEGRWDELKEMSKRDLMRIIMQHEKQLEDDSIDLRQQIDDLTADQLFDEIQNKQGNNGLRKAFRQLKYDRDIAVVA